MLSVSSGMHLVLPGDYSPKSNGILIPKTLDNRVVFVLPWLNHTLVGTTDDPAEACENPIPKAEDIDYLAKQISPYLNKPFQKKDVLAWWSGLRPLVGSTKLTTAKLSRDHIIDLSSSDLVTITGGKWTTYRLMAKDVVDSVETLMGKDPSAAEPAKVSIAGAAGYHNSHIEKLRSQFNLSAEVAEHLSQNYGTEADKILLENPDQIHPELPYLIGEIKYSIMNEFATNIVDFVYRRLRIGFLDYRKTEMLLEPVALKMGEIFGWDHKKIRAEINAASTYFASGKISEKKNESN